jgi:hypothetical protein
MHQAQDTFITTLHIAAAVIDWRSSEKFAAKLSFMPPWSPVYVCFVFFEISSPMWPNRRFQCHLFLTLRITSLSQGHTQLVCSCIHIVSYTQVALHIFFKASPPMVSMWWNRQWIHQWRPPGPWKATAFRALEKHYKSLINTVKSYLLTAPCF